MCSDFGLDVSVKVNASLHAYTRWGQTIGAEKGLLQKVHGEHTGGSCPSKPWTPQRVLAKCKVRERCGWLLQTSWYGNPLFSQLSMWAWSWCSCKSPTRQMFFSVLQLFTSIWMKKCYTLENGLSCIFQTIGSLLGGDMCACSVVSHSLRPHGLACQAPLSMGFSRQEYWSGLSFPGDLPDPEIKLASPT